MFCTACGAKVREDKDDEIESLTNNKELIQQAKEIQQKQQELQLREKERLLAEKKEQEELKKQRVAIELEEAKIKKEEELKILKIEQERKQAELQEKKRLELARQKGAEEARLERIRLERIEQERKAKEAERIAQIKAEEQAKIKAKEDELKMKELQAKKRSEERKKQALENKQREQLQLQKRQVKVRSIKIKKQTTTTSAGGSRLAKMRAMWNEKQAKADAEQTSNIFSKDYKANKILKPGDKNYGQAPVGSKSAERAKRAKQWVKEQIKILIGVMEKHGTKNNITNSLEITFGELFIIYQDISDTLVGMLQRSKKFGLVSFESEMLFQGQNDNDLIRLEPKALNWEP